MVYNSKYNGNCQIGETGHNACKMINRPNVVVEPKPFIKSWWEKAQIQRQYRLKEETTE